MTELGKEKQALAVTLSLPEDDKRKIKEKVFGKMKLDGLNSENGTSRLKFGKFRQSSKFGQ